MNKIIYIFIIFLLFGCSIINYDNIEGTWLVTHVSSSPASNDEAYYYKFNSDNTFYKDKDKSKLKAPIKDSNGDVILSQSPEGFGDYLISNGTLNLDFSILYGSSGIDTEYTCCTINGSTMYWYWSLIEKIRLSKE